jgi:hypothetical protein
VWKKIPDEVAAASRDDPTPVFGVCLERVTLERIDLVADEARNSH